MKKSGIAGLIAVLILLAGCKLDPDTPLTNVAAQGRVEEVEGLLGQGRSPNEKDSHGWTPLMWAARKGHTAVVRALLKAGANPDVTDGYVNGWTALMHAIHKGENPAVQTLLDGGADANAKTHNGLTALIMAAGDGNLEIVRLLLARGADPRAATTQGVTALAIAVSGGAFSDIDRPLLGGCYTDIVKDLLAKAPDLQLQDNWAGRYARFFARLKGCSEIITLLDRRKKALAVRVAIEN